MYPPYDELSDFMSFDDWLMEYVTRNPGIKISFNRLKFNQYDVDIEIELRHITGFKIAHVINFNAHDNISKKRKLIEEIGNMTYMLKEQVNAFNRGVD